VLDGYVARLDRSRQSTLGADLDSLADVISFGVAPAVLGFTLGLRGGWDMLCLTYFVVCGVSRLARFNVTAEALADTETGKVKYFEGTPIPTSISSSSSSAWRSGSAGLKASSGLVRIRSDRRSCIRSR
jgi:CDP-diacylglycerol--serine O-phosphatidyltransferase